MAGCKPEYFPLVLLALETLAEEQYNLYGTQATTHPCTPMLIFNGPIAKEVGLNSGNNVMGNYFRANAAIGRAVRLALVNIGAAIPGTGDMATAGTPAKFRLYSVSEDGLYGPGIDNDFASNKWLYLYYSPLTVTDVKLSTGQVVTQTTPIANAPTAPQASLTAWDPWVGYFQLSRFKLVEDAQGNLSMDFDSEQQIMRVAQNRGSCCHVGGMRPQELCAAQNRLHQDLAMDTPISRGRV